MFGVPYIIISDNGTQFSIEPFEGWCEKMNIQQRFTSVAHPQANRQTEVTNHTILKGISTILSRAKDKWAE